MRNLRACDCAFQDFANGFTCGKLDGATVRMLAGMAPARGDKRWCRIFNGLTGRAGKRNQARLPHTAALRRLWLRMRPAFLQDYRFRNAHMLQSEPGCARQKFHCDFAGGGGLGVLVALQSATVLLVEMAGEPACLQLNRGDYIIFDGRLPHAGAAYSVLNVRLHMYCSVDGVRPPANETYIVQRR